MLRTKSTKQKTGLRIETQQIETQQTQIQQAKTHLTGKGRGVRLMCQGDSSAQRERRDQTVWIGQD